MMWAFWEHLIWFQTATKSLQITKVNFMSDKLRRFLAVITWTWSENTLNSLVDSTDSLLRIYLHHSFLLLTFYLLFLLFFPPVVMASPQRFLGNSLLQWDNMASAAASVPWHVELMFRTRQASATLLHISSGLQHNLTLQVRSNIHLHLFSPHTETHKHTFLATFESRSAWGQVASHFSLRRQFYSLWNVAMRSNADLSSRGETFIRKRRNILKDFKVICHSIWQITWIL